MLGALGSTFLILPFTLPRHRSGDRTCTPEFLDQAAVLAIRISRNHPLLDGNKRLAWGCLNMLSALNGHDLHVPTEEAVRTMLSVAAGDLASKHRSVA